MSRQGQQDMLFDHIDLGGDPELASQLVAIALDLVRQTPGHGVTVGEVVHLAESRGMKIGGAPMSNVQLEERQTSWLRNVLPAAGLVATDRTRKSPVKRHKGRRQVVYVQPAPAVFYGCRRGLSMDACISSFPTEGCGCIPAPTAEGARDDG